MNYAIPKNGIFAISFVLLAIAGCAGIGHQLESPRVSLVSIRDPEITGLEASLDIEMRVFNANEVDLKVKGIKVELEINGRPFAAGVSNTPVDIPSYGTALAAVTLYSSVVDMFKGVYGLKDAAGLKYRLNGNLRVSGGNMPATTLPFESEGRVNLTPSKDQP